MSALLLWMKNSPEETAAIGTTAAVLILILGDVATDIIRAWRRG